jgi:hypothetical protein
MNAAATTPLTWPPTVDPQPRWAHQMLHAIADIHQRTWTAHQHLVGLRAELLDRPFAPGQLAPRLRGIDHTIIDPHDCVELHQLLDRHGLSHITSLLRRAQHHRGGALQTLRHLTDADQRRWLDPASTTPQLDQADTHLATAGHLLTKADHALIDALQDPPPRGGDCYPT